MAQAMEESVPPDTMPRDRRASYFDVNGVASVSGPVISEADAKGKVMCPMLLYSIITIGASSFLFGYDNAIISPVVSL